MPWNDQNGGGGGPWGSGGGSGDGKNGSPWGKPPGDGQKGPDLEDQLRKVQDRFKGSFRGNGGSGGSGGKGFGAFGLVVLIVVVVLAWLASGFVIVQPGQQAAVFQFGKWERNLRSGPHFHLPYPVESHEIVEVESRRETQIGGTRDESLMLTKDENIADVQFTVVWKVKTLSPQEYILNVKDPEATVRMVAESVMREVVGKSELQRVITTERGEIELTVANLTQELLDQYKTGVNILNIQIAKGDPPQQVIGAFNDVNVAQQDAEQAINRATQEANKLVPDARGEASQILQQAEAYRDQVVADATGEASRFDQIFTEYRKAPQITKERMYLESMERVLKRTDKLILDSDSGAVPYLPLDRAPRVAPSGN